MSPKVISVGGRLGYEAGTDCAETPNTQFVVHDYGDSMLIFEVRGLWDKAGTGRMSELKRQVVGHVIECENGYLAGTVAYDKDDKEIRRFKGDPDLEKGDDHFANFAHAVRTHKKEELHADILEGHLSSALCHTGNISYRLGKETGTDEIHEALKTNKAANETMDRFQAHLEANEVDLKKTKPTLGVFLEMDPATERFTNNEQANTMLRREYRKPFEVPENV